MELTHLKVGSYYKGLNDDGTFIVYKVIERYQDYVVVKIIVDHDKSGFVLDEGWEMEILCLDLNPKINKWLSESKLIKNKSELLAVVM